MDEVKTSLEPGETLGDLIKKALYQYLTNRENRAGLGETAYFEQIGILKPSLMLRTRGLNATILFYQQLGFSVLYRDPHSMMAIANSRGLRIAFFSIQT